MKLVNKNSGYENNVRSSLHVSILKNTSNKTQEDDNNVQYVLNEN